jgi:hypothetical protein
VLALAADTVGLAAGLGLRLAADATGETGTRFAHWRMPRSENRFALDRFGAGCFRDMRRRAWVCVAQGAANGGPDPGSSPGRTPDPSPGQAFAGTCGCRRGIPAQRMYRVGAAGECAASTTGSSLRPRQPNPGPPGFGLFSRARDDGLRRSAQTTST